MQVAEAPLASWLLSKQGSRLPQAEAGAMCSADMAGVTKPQALHMKRPGFITTGSDAAVRGRAIRYSLVAGFQAGLVTV